MDFAEFDKKFDIERMKKELKELANNEGESQYKEVPHGKYEVKIDKLEVKYSKKGSPMLTCWFKILEGEFKNSFIFMNQVLDIPFCMYKSIKFLKSLTTSIPIEFESYEQYKQLVFDIHEEIDNKLEFVLDYGTDKGYNTFKIIDVFEV